MQVADDSAARAALMAAGRDALAKVAGASPTRGMPSAPAQYALRFIADSTQLSGSDKKFLTQLVAIADELGSDDGKLFEAILTLARVLAANNPPGRYPATPMREVIQDYWEKREALRGEAAGDITARAAINAAAIERNVPEVLLKNGMLEA